MSVAASAVPSVDAILTSWRENAPAGPDAISAAADREQHDEQPSGDPRHGGEG